jgi:hypothetical protein
MCVRNPCSHMPARACSLPVSLTARACSYMTKNAGMESPGDKGKGKEKDSGRFKCPSERGGGGGGGGKEAVRRRRLETTARTSGLRVKQESSVLWPREVGVRICVFSYLVETERKRERERESLLGAILHNGGPGRRR